MNWDPLATGDPLAGDPPGILHLTQLLSNYAQECTSSSSRVKNLGNIDWSSDAAKAFEQRRNAFAPKLDLVAARLTSTAVALQQYALKLDEIQLSAQGYRTSAQSVLAELRAITPLAEAQMQHNAHQELGMSLGKPGVPWSGPDYVAQMQTLESSFSRLQISFNGLVTQYQTIAQTCTLQLQQVSHDALANNLFSVLGQYLNDAEGDFKDALGVVNSLLPGFSAALHAIAIVAGVLALIVIVVAVLSIPGLDAVALATLFTFLTTVASAATLATTIPDVVLAQEGKSSWSKVGMDLLSDATFGLFKVAEPFVEEDQAIIDFQRGLGYDTPFFQDFPKLIRLESLVLHIVKPVEELAPMVEGHATFIQHQFWSIARESLPIMRLSPMLAGV